MITSALENRIITDILRNKNLHVYQSAGIRIDMFKDPLMKKVYNMIENHTSQRETLREYPSIAMIKQEFPSFGLVKISSEDDTGAKTLARELKKKALGTNLRDISTTFAEMVENDPEEALKFFRGHLSEEQFKFEKKGDFGLKELLSTVKNVYQNAQSPTGHKNPWPWDCLTNDTKGKRPGNFFLFYSRAKQMKTWVLLKCAIYDFIVNKRKVLIWSREMSKDEICMRIGSIIGEVDYQCMTHGMLPPHLYDKAIVALENVAKLDRRTDEQKIKAADKDHADLLLMCGEGTPTSLESVMMMAKFFGAEVVYLDSYYHADTAESKSKRQDHDRLRYLTEAVKQNAIDLGIPIVATSQANRFGEMTAGETMADLFRTDAASQECDGIFRLIKRKVSQELYEDDYEFYWDTLERAQSVNQSRRSVDTSKYVRRMNQTEVEVERQPIIKVQFSRLLVDRSVPEKIKREILTGNNVVRRPKAPRRSAELACMIAGAREGIMDGFTFKAIPGYEWSTVLEDITPEQIKNWLKQDQEQANEHAPGPDGDGKSSRYHGRGTPIENTMKRMKGR